MCIIIKYKNTLLAVSSTTLQKYQSRKYERKCLLQLEMTIGHRRRPTSRRRDNRATEKSERRKFCLSDLEGVDRNL